MGAAYETGSMVPKDLKKARDLLQKAADQNYEPALEALKA